MNSHSGNNTVTDACFGKSRHCVVYTFVLTFSSFIFVASMILTVYLTHIASIDKAVVVLIVGSCLLFLLGFSGNMYTIYHSIPSTRPSENGENPNRLSQITGVSAQNTSVNARAPDIVSFPRARELFGKTPPPPYEVQLSEMSRMLLPGTSRTTESSAREAEITEEARKLVQRIYEEINMRNQLEPQSSIGEQSEQQMVRTSKTPVRRQGTMSPKVSHQNLMVQKQQTVMESSPSRELTPVGFYENQVIQQRVARSSLPTQLELGRLMISSKGCSAVPSQLSPRIPGRPSVDFRTNQDIQQKVTPNSPPNQPDLERIIIGREGCVDSPPQMSPQREDFLKAARKRKLTCLSQELQTMPKTIENITHMKAVDSDSQNNEYEEIEVVESTQRANSSRVAYDPVEYYCTERVFEDPSEQASSVTSAVSEAGPSEQKRNFGTSSVKERLQLSALSTRKFYQLGQSPATVLDAIATCFDLTPDEWMFAWKLTQNGIPPKERAKILGVRLQEDSYNDDN